MDDQSRLHLMQIPESFNDLLSLPVGTRRVSDDDGRGDGSERG
jgi:hypothetical protein